MNSIVMFKTNRIWPFISRCSWPTLQTRNPRRSRVGGCLDGMLKSLTTRCHPPEARDARHAAVPSEPLLCSSNICKYSSLSGFAEAMMLRHIYWFCRSAKPIAARSKFLVVVFLNCLRTSAASSCGGEKRRNTYATHCRDLAC